MWHVACGMCLAWKTGGNQEFGNGNGNGNGNETGTAMDMPNAATAKLQGQAASLGESPVGCLHARCPVRPVPICGVVQSQGTLQRPTLSSGLNVMCADADASQRAAMEKVLYTQPEGPKELFGSSA
jgi:hypothetical protein